MRGQQHPASSRTVKGKLVILLWHWFNLVPSPQPTNSFIILPQALTLTKKWRWFSDWGSDGVFNIIIWGLFIHPELHQWHLMIYLYGLSVTSEELWSKSHIHSRPWKPLEGLPAVQAKAKEGFLLSFLLPGFWNYTWNTLFRTSRFGRYLRAHSSFREMTLYGSQ